MKTKSNLIEKGYRPADKLYTTPPTGGSAVPSLPPAKDQERMHTSQKQTSSHKQKRGN